MGVNLLILEREKFPGSQFHVTSEPTFGSIPWKFLFLPWNDLRQRQIPGIGALLPGQALPREFGSQLGSSFDLPALPHPTLARCPWE